MSALDSLGIDFYSLILYLVNFGIVVFFIGKYLSGPIISMIDKRSQTIKANLSEADKLKEEMLIQRKHMEDEYESMKLTMSEEMRKLKVELEDKRIAAEKELELRRAKMLEDLNKDISEQKSRIKADLKSEITKTIQNIVTNIVSEKVSDNVIKESVDSAWSGYKNND